MPVSYGNINLAKIDTAGGLSMAAVDLGRIAAMLVTTADTPGMQRSTVEQMMNAGIAAGGTFGGRAGHGWDGVGTRSGGRFYAQKGGSLSTSGNVLQIDGEWGLLPVLGGQGHGGGADPRRLPQQRRS